MGSLAHQFVIPAKAGIHAWAERLRRTRFAVVRA